MFAVEYAIQTVGDQQWVVSPALQALGVCHGVTLRPGGVSQGPYAALNLGGRVGDQPQAVAENQQLLARAVAAQARQNPAWHRVSQVHGTRILQARENTLWQPGQANDLPQADGLWTDQPGQVLCVHVADCLPVILYAPNPGLLAVVHAGWRGTAGGIASRAAVQLAAAGADMRQVRAFIGPGIGPCCFAVGPDCARQFDAGVVHTVNGQPYVDLWQANAQDLARVGVLPQHITIAGLCTVCHHDRLFSHRAGGGTTGRMAAFGVL